MLTSKLPQLEPKSYASGSPGVRPVQSPRFPRLKLHGDVAAMLLDHQDIFASICHSVPGAKYV